MSLALRIAFTLAAAVGPFATALAADYDPPIYAEQPAEYVPVEVGSGWYLRGDVGYNFKQNYNNTSFSAFSPSLIEPFSDIGPFSPLNDISYSEDEVPVQASIGFGYHFNDFIRGDLNIGGFGESKYSMSGVIPNEISPATGCGGSVTRTQTPVDGNGVPTGPTVVTDGPNGTTLPCLADADVKNTAWNGMANGYVDLGTFAGFTPYVGGGVGVYYTSSKVSASASCQSIVDSSTAGGTETPDTYLCSGQNDVDDPNTVVASANYSDSSYNLMYALSAGFSYQMTQNTSVDVGYQYMSSPDALYYTIGSSGLESHEGIDYHQVRIGLRYDLW